MTSSLLTNKERYIENFASSVYDEFRRLKYGIKSCTPNGKLWLNVLRNEIIEYQLLGDDPNVCEKACAVDPLKVSIECNSNICNTSCTIVKVGTALNAFVYTQVLPAPVWTIIHNLGYVPNVFAEDDNGIDIVGVVSVINNNELTITFNNPIAGVAYLS